MASNSNKENQDVSNVVSDPKLENEDTHSDYQLGKMEELPAWAVKQNFELCPCFGRTLLHAAAERGRIDMIKDILKEGEDVNVRDNHGWTPLTSAAFNGELETVKYLVSQNAIIKAYDIEGRTPNMRAAERGYDEVIKFLASFGELPELPNLDENHFSE